METGISKAIRLVGSQTALGNMLGLTPQAIQKWATQGFVPGDRCLVVEAKLDGQVTRYELNPAVFGTDPAQAASVCGRTQEASPPARSYGRRSNDQVAASAITHDYDGKAV